MAIATMAKVLIVTYRTQASELLESLQREGICQILSAKEATVSKDLPEAAAAAQRPRDIEGLLSRLEKSTAFLNGYARTSKGLAGVFSPRTVVDEQLYNKVISDRQILNTLDQCEQLETGIEKSKGRIENLHNTLETLYPWESLETPVEEIGRLRRTTCWTGLLPPRQFEQIEQKIAESGAAIQKIGDAAGKFASIIVGLKEQADEVQKLLRSADFEQVTFEPMTGTVAELIRRYSQELSEAEQQLHDQYEQATLLSESLLELQILHDHYENLLNREQTKNSAPVTTYTVVLEGWVKEKNYGRLEKVVAGFQASSLARIEPAEGEEVPVEVENRNFVRPFEMITRLYGMPVSSGVDPTACLAPFFMLFFGICLADVGYGLVMAAIMVWLIKKTQGSKGPLWMFLICAAITIPVGAITGSWFGDAVPTFIPVLNPMREKLMLFDPLNNPMAMFKLAMILGYIQIMTGLAIAFVHNLKQKDYVAAVCDNLTWLIMLNCIVIFGLSKAGIMPAGLGKFLGLFALVPAVMILLFSQRQGRWAGRIGMGTYNLFSTVFYLGDLLSYLRLAALCMTGGGIAMAINVIAKISLDMPYGLGILAMVLVLVFGHTLNLVLSALGAFVHTLRLQYVEFFTKFFVGGGKLFEPLRKEYKHIYIK